jgi:cell wall-associated NlpC family hydrolase
MAVVAAAAVVLTAGVIATGGGAAATPAPNITTVRRQVETLQSEAEKATEQYNATREKLKSVTVMAKAAMTRVGQQQAAVDVARLALGKLAVETYKAGDLQVVRLLLDDDPQALLAARSLRSTVSDRQAQAVSRLVAAQVLLVEDQSNLAAQRKELATQTTRQADLKKTVENKLAAARRLLSQLDAGQQAAIRRAGSSMDRQALEDLGVTVPANGVLKCSDVGIQAPDARVKKVIDFACAQLGKPYQWGGDGPGSYDCSGLTMAAWSTVGVSLPHNAAMQSKVGTTVSQANLRPGDLVFFNSYNHMGLYIGKGLMIHAPHTGDVVRIASSRLDGRLIKAVRI